MMPLSNGDIDLGAPAASATCRVPGPARDVKRARRPPPFVAGRRAAPATDWLRMTLEARSLPAEQDHYFIGRQVPEAEIRQPLTRRSVLAVLAIESATSAGGWRRASSRWREALIQEGGDVCSLRCRQFALDAQKLREAAESDERHIDDAAVAEPGQFRADEAEGALDL